MAKKQGSDNSEESRSQFLKETQNEWELLRSVVHGMYDEVDKLTKKAPADEISELALRRINQVIKQSKTLLAGDPYVDSIEIFVAAGENPEYRDVLMILREITEGLLRQEDERKERTRPYSWKP